MNWHPLTKHNDLIQENSVGTQIFKKHTLKGHSNVHLSQILLVSVCVLICMFFPGILQLYNICVSFSLYTLVSIKFSLMYMDIHTFLSLLRLTGVKIQILLLTYVCMCVSVCKRFASSLSLLTMEGSGLVIANAKVVP